MEPIEYPKWKYHDTEAACVVDNADAEEALGEGWRDTPDVREAVEEVADAPRRGRPRKA